MLLTACRLSKVLQLTLAVIKPDAVAHPLILQDLHEAILDNKFMIVRCKELVWRRSDSERFYAEHSGRFFYQRLVEFMSSERLLALKGCFGITSSFSSRSRETVVAMVTSLSPMRLDTLMSGPMRAYILAREDAIHHWREQMGPTKVFQARYTSPASLRAQFGLTDTRNTTHGSDSPESARREISFFFPDFHVDEWLEREEPLFRSGQIRYDAQKHIHTLLSPS